MTIGERIKKRRQELSISATQLAEKLDKDRTTVYRYESNYIENMPIGVLGPLSAALNTTPAYLMGWTETSTENNIGEYHKFSLSAPEKALISTYRQLTPNSRQIIMTLSQMELNHVKANAQGEMPIKIIKKTKEEVDEFIARKLHTKTEAQRQEYIKVYNQSAAAGYGNYLDDDSFETVALPSVPNGAEFGIRIQGDSMKPKINDGDIVFVKRKLDLEPGEIGIFIYNGNSYCKQLAYKDETYYLHSLNGKYNDIPLYGDSIYCVGKVIL